MSTSVQAIELTQDKGQMGCIFRINLTFYRLANISSTAPHFLFQSLLCKALPISSNYCTHKNPGLSLSKPEFNSISMDQIPHSHFLLRYWGGLLPGISIHVHKIFEIK